MSALIARVGIPYPGKQAEAYEFAKKRTDAINKAYGVNTELFIRFGGPVGEIVGLTRHASVAEIEAVKRKIIAATNKGDIPTSPDHLFASVHEYIWLQP
ncbi:MAG: hypothetical protein KGN16_00410 [Burkholderiales bacterium]|nr:hypothetical protein [Burkholderiales bacterium]